MKYITEKEQEDGIFEYGRLIKALVLKGKNDDDFDNIVTLWWAEKESLIKGYQVEESSFFVYVQLGDFFNCESLKTKELAEAYEKFNAIEQTIKA